MAHAVPLLKKCHENELILEVEACVVGGEEEGLNRIGVAKEKLYRTPKDMLAVHDALSAVPGASYMFAATFRNVHGVYKPGNVVLAPDILKAGSELADIHETLDYGVIKMNVDTDTQYAFTRPIIDHMLKNYDQILKVDSEIGVKKAYDPRSWKKIGRAGMADRLVQACQDLKSAGKLIGR